MKASVAATSSKISVDKWIKLLTKSHIASQQRRVRREREGEQWVSGGNWSKDRDEDKNKK